MTDFTEFTLALVFSSRSVYRVSEVNVLTGRSGWYKRINDNKNDVSRKAVLTDDQALDKDGTGYSRVFGAAKKEVLAKNETSVTATMHTPASNQAKHSREAETLCFITLHQFGVLVGLFFFLHVCFCSELL